MATENKGKVADTILRWEERLADDRRAGRDSKYNEDYKDEEIADLRAALASQMPRIRHLEHERNLALAASRSQPQGEPVATALRASLSELVAAMRLYEWDCDGEATIAHRDMMARADTVLLENAA